MLTTPGGLLSPLPISDQVWTNVSMDFITRLLHSGGQDMIMVVVDRMSKYAHFVPLSNPYTTKDVADLFVRHIIKMHGILKTIASDRDRAFCSNF